VVAAPAAAPAAAAARTLVILNARSGSGHDASRASELQPLFAAAGLAAEFVLAQDAGAIEAAVERAVGSGVAMVVAGGGDGTQSAVAARLAGTPIVQGVLPLGTLNHFAKDLGIPLKLEDAVRTLAEGRVLEVDVGEVNGHVFINNSSLGLYPEIVRERELLRQRLGKDRWRALASAALHATRGRPALAVRVASGDGQQVRRTPFVFVGNNRYSMAGFDIGGRQSLQAGELVLYMSRRQGRLGLLSLALRALARRLEQGHDFETLTGTRFEVGTHAPRMRVAADGEVLVLDTPLHYRIRPRALRVMVAPALR
jgi:diacylglycerol kinase family enzyme